MFGLVFQIFENIGAAIGLLPLTGIPLPFLSQGGTSLIAISIAMGIIFGLDKFPIKAKNRSYPLKESRGLT